MRTAFPHNNFWEKIWREFPSEVFDLNFFLKEQYLFRNYYIASQSEREIPFQITEFNFISNRVWSRTVSSLPSRIFLCKIRIQMVLISCAGARTLINQNPIIPPPPPPPPCLTPHHAQYSNFNAQSPSTVSKYGGTSIWRSLRYNKLYCSSWPIVCVEKCLDTTKPRYSQHILQSLGPSLRGGCTIVS